MVRKYLLLNALSLLSFRALSQSGPELFYPSSSCYSSGFIDAFSFTGNTAAHARVKNAQAAVYGETPYLQQGLKNMLAAGAVPAKFGSIGLSAKIFGDMDYGENTISLACARSLGTKLDLGIQFNYNTLRISGYGGASAVTADLGTIIHFTEKFRGGIQIRNPVGGRWGDENSEKFPAVFSFGFGYEPSKGVLFTGEIIKDEQRPVKVNASIKYKLHSRVVASIGCATMNPAFWLAAGFSLIHLQLTAVASWHMQLGITPGLAIRYAFIKSKKEKE